MPYWFPPKGLPALWLVLTLVGCAALIVGAAVALRVKTPAWRTILWVFCVAAPVAATWTVPTGARPAPHWPYCHRGKWFEPSMLGTGMHAEVLSNIVLLVPAGMAAMLWPAGVRRLAALATALTVPVLIEAGQLLPALNRTCQVGDVINNSLGVLVGFSLGAGISAVFTSWRRAAAVPRR